MILHTPTSPLSFRHWNKTLQSQNIEQFLYGIQSSLGNSNWYHKTRAIYIQTQPGYS